MAQARQNADIRPNPTSLEDALRLHYGPNGACKAKQSTAAGYRESLGLWRQFLSDPSRNHRIASPVVTQQSIREFREWLEARGLAKATAGKHLAGIARLARLANPAAAAGIKVERGGRDPKWVPTSLGKAQLGALYRACEGADWPPAEFRSSIVGMRWLERQAKRPQLMKAWRRVEGMVADHKPRRLIQATFSEALSAEERLCFFAGTLKRRATVYAAFRNPVPPQLWWHTALVTWVITGLRLQDVVSLERNMIGLTRSDLFFDSRCPNESVSEESPHGWLWRVPEKTNSVAQGREPKVLLMPLHRVLRSHVEAVIRLRSDDLSDEILLCPSGKGFRRTLAAIYDRARREIALPPPEILKQVHVFRASTNQLWNKAVFAAPGGQLVKANLGPNVLCHPSQRGANGAYENRVDEMVGAVDTLDLPPEFMAGAERLCPDQGRLF